ncbi:MAG: hypothetical protein AAF352_06270, partial [Pseudomonadota bacterium]
MVSLTDSETQNIDQSEQPPKLHAQLHVDYAVIIGMLGSIGIVVIVGLTNENAVFINLQALMVVLGG